MSLSSTSRPHSQKWTQNLSVITWLSQNSKKRFLKVVIKLDHPHFTIKLLFNLVFTFLHLSLIFKQYSEVATILIQIVSLLRWVFHKISWWILSHFYLMQIINLSSSNGWGLANSLESFQRGLFTQTRNLISLHWIKSRWQLKFQISMTKLNNQGNNLPANLCIRWTFLTLIIKIQVLQEALIDIKEIFNSKGNILALIILWTHKLRQHSLCSKIRAFFSIHHSNKSILEQAKTLLYQEIIMLHTLKGT